MLYGHQGAPATAFSAHCMASVCWCRRA